MQTGFIGIVYASIVVSMSTLLGVPTVPEVNQPVATVERLVTVEQPEEVVIEEVKEEPKTIDELIDENFGDQANNARKVMKCESGGRPDAVGDTSLTFYQDGILYGYSVGLFQIRRLKGRPEKEQLLDPEFNIRYAADMQRAQGWQPWSCKRVLR